MLLNICIILLVSTSCVKSEENREVLIEIAKDWSPRLVECFKVMEFGGYVFDDIANFWRRDWIIQNRGTGCAFLCIFRGLNFVDGHGNLNENNAEGYIVSKGGDDSLIQSLRESAQFCKDMIAAEQLVNVCEITMHAIECYRQQLFNMGTVLEVTRRIFSNFINPPRCRRRRNGHENAIHNGLVWEYTSAYSNGSTLRFSKYMY